MITQIKKGRDNKDNLRMLKFHYFQNKVGSGARFAVAVHGTTEIFVFKISLKR